MPLSVFRPQSILGLPVWTYSALLYQCVSLFLSSSRSYKHSVLLNHPGCRSNTVWLPTCTALRKHWLIVRYILPWNAAEGDSFIGVEKDTKGVVCQTTRLLMANQLLLGFSTVFKLNYNHFLLISRAFTNPCWHNLESHLKITTINNLHLLQYVWALFYMLVQADEDVFLQLQGYD